jgi:hypothetical protein
MSNTYTSNTQLAMPASGDRTWNVALNGNCATLDALGPVGSLNVTTTEVPSATLCVRVAPGSYLTQSGTVAAYAGAASTALTAGATNYLYLDLTASGSLAVNTTGFPATAHVPLSTVAAGTATITSIADARVAFAVAGPVADGTAWTLGTSAGLQIGTGGTQKLGFFGKTPAAQPTMGAATAGSSYTTNEQAMIQAVYNAVRALGLGS